jgi:beta-glucosidase
MIMIPNGPGQKNNYVQFINLTKELVEEKKIPVERIDDATRRILRIKFALGLFEHPFADPDLTALVGSAEHRQVARECVRQSLVLLKNERQTLPLSKRIKHLAVAGRAAADLGIQCGGWTIDWQGRSGEVTKGGTTILDALRQSAPAGMDIAFSPDGTGVKGADAVIVVIGEKPYAEMKGDRKDLRLDAEDLAVLEKASEAGVPVVTVLISGRPLVLGRALDASDAFVAAWLPGTEGQGIADVLLGVFKPTGKLPRAWPRSNEQLASSAQGAPLFPFGFGLTF